MSDNDREREKSDNFIKTYGRSGPIDFSKFQLSEEQIRQSIERFEKTYPGIQSVRDEGCDLDSIQLSGEIFGYASKGRPTSMTMKATSTKEHPDQATLVYSADRLNTLLERATQTQKAIEGFVCQIKWTPQRVQHVITDLLDICKRYPHRDASFYGGFCPIANHISWTYLVDVLRGSPMRTESRDLPISGRSYSIGSGWFTTYFRKMLTDSGLFEIYRDPHHKGTERVRVIHFLDDEPAMSCFHGKRVRIMPYRKDIEEIPDAKAELQRNTEVGRTGKAFASAYDQTHAGDMYLVELDPITKEEIDKSVVTLAMACELEPIF